MKIFIFIALLLNIGVIFCVPNKERTSGEYIVNIYETSTTGSEYKDKVIRIQMSISDSKSTYHMTCLNKYSTKESISLAGFNIKNSEMAKLLASMICELRIKHADNKEETRFNSCCDINNMVDKITEFLSLTDKSEEEIDKKRFEIAELFKKFIDEKFKKEDSN